MCQTPDREFDNRFRVKSVVKLSDREFDRDESKLCQRSGDLTHLIVILTILVDLHSMITVSFLV